MAPQNLRTIHVVGAAIYKNGLYLITQRSASMSNPLLWEFPGGKIEAGETPEEALKREIKEELCLEIKVLDFITRSKTTYHQTHIILDIYGAELIAGHLLLKEHKDARWCLASDFGQFNWAEADLPAVYKLKQNI